MFMIWCEKFRRATIGGYIMGTNLPRNKGPEQK